MPKPFPKEFREDVIRVYRSSDASLAQVAKDFRISPSCLKRWITIDDKKSADPTPAGRAPRTSQTHCVRRTSGPGRGRLPSARTASLAVFHATPSPSATRASDKSRSSGWAV